MGAAGAAAGVGIVGIFGDIGSFGHELLRGGAHALSSGIQTELAGGSFLQGAMAGGFSSGIGSGIDALGGNASHQIFGGGLGGGFGAVIGGGNFFKGFGQGIAMAAFNHVLHSGVSALDSPEKLPDGGYIWQLSDEELALFAYAETKITGYWI